MEFRFASPEWLFLLLALPIVAWLVGRRGRSAAVTFSSARLLRGIAGVRRRIPGLWPLLGRMLALALLIGALARPQFGEGTIDEEASGIDILMTIDLSSSMWAHDFDLGGAPTDRLTVVKLVVREFVEQRPNDRLGLIAFAAEPYLVSPLTLNHDWLIENLDRLEIGLIEDGTAIGSAIAMGANRLRGLEAEARVMVLLTDGANNRGDLEPSQAAEAAAAYGVKIYAVGAGKQGIVPFPRTDREGNLLRDRQGRLMFTRGRSDVDLETLQEVADTTGGLMFHADDTSRLVEDYAQIDELEKTEVEITFRTDYDEAFFWPLGVGLVLLGFEQLLRQTRYRMVP